MGRRKQDEVIDQTENLDEQVTEETEIQEEALTDESQDMAASEEETEEKPKRQRRSRKAKTEIAAAEAETSPEDGSENAEVVCEEEQAETLAPKKQRGGRKKQDLSPEAQIALATEAMQKTMDEMVKHWQTVQNITGNVSAQLEKVAHIVKPSIHDFVNTDDSLVPPRKENSQFALRFTAAASIIAVLFSLVSMSLSQSARTVALNAEATRVANSQWSQNPPALPRNPEVAFQRPKSKR